MNTEEKLVMLDISKTLHNQVEANYLKHPAHKNDDNWLEKQRLLLADMSLHLLQTAINPEPINLDRLRDNLHAILTISDSFLPNIDLKKATTNLYKNS